MTRKLIPLVASLTLALAAGCGNKKEGEPTKGESPKGEAGKGEASSGEDWPAACQAAIAEYECYIGKQAEVDKPNYRDMLGEFKKAWRRQSGVAVEGACKMT